MISIIIPTFNRKEILRKCLAALKNQTFKDFEIIVVDDGSTDGTEEVAVGVKYFKKNHEGQGIARNYGIDRAEGDIILFLGDDIILSPEALKEHLKSFEEGAVLGYVKWHPEIKTTSFMKWLAPCGFNFNFCDIKEEADFSHFYTANISVGRKWLLKEKFDPAFKGYGFEDIDLGYRLSKRGLKIKYNPKAVGLHYHEVTLKEFCSKSEQIAKALIIFSDKYPELKNKWIKPINPTYIISSIIRKIPYLNIIWPNLYFLSEVTFHKYKVLKEWQKN